MPKYKAEIRMSGKPDIPVYVEADTHWDAEALFKAQYPNHDVLFLKEIDILSRDSRDVDGSNSTNGSGSSNPPSLKELFFGLIFLVVAVSLFGLYTTIKEKFSDSEQATEASASAEAEEQASETTPGSETEARGEQIEAPDHSALASESEVDSPIERVTDDLGQFPFRARITDRRSEIVLQSSPTMTSRNVAKLPTGTVVVAQTDQGKWIRIRTEDRLEGFVRQKQLEFLQ